MKRQIIILSLAVIVLSNISIGCKKNDKDTKMEAEAMPVEVSTPVIDSVTLTREYPGTIVSNHKAEVVGRVNGQLLSCRFSGGQYVQKGQVLFTIESTQYRDAVNQASATLATAKSQYEYAKQQYEAMKKALAANAVSEISVRQAESNMKSAAASIQSAQAALNEARMNLGYCTVTAPISGHISGNTVDPGSYINGAGAPVVLATIYDDAVVAAKFAIDETQFNELTDEKGFSKPYFRKVPVAFNDQLEHTYFADMQKPSPFVNKNTGTIEIQGNIDNKWDELKDGMYVTISLPYGSNPKAILINDASIGTDQLGQYVYLVNDSNKVVYTPIKTGGLYQDTLRIVESGIKPTDRYVTKALLTVRNGEKVKPVMKH